MAIAFLSLDCHIDGVTSGVPDDPAEDSSFGEVPLKVREAHDEMRPRRPPALCCCLDARKEAHLSAGTTPLCA